MHKIQIITVHTYFTSIVMRGKAILTFTLLSILLILASQADATSLTANSISKHGEVFAKWGRQITPEAPIPSYPGLGVKGNVVDTGLRSVLAGLQAYYQVFGQWPASWQAVIDSGLYQTPIYGYNREVINPDDTYLGFLGDIYYDPRSANQEKAMLRMLLNIDGTVLYTHIVEPVPTIKEILKGYEAVWQDGSSEKYLSDINWQKFLAIRSMLYRDIGLFGRMHDRAPSSIDELLNLGISPINTNSVNPLTGDKFYFDGRPLDLQYEVFEGEGFRFCHTEENGEHPLHPFFF